MSLRLFLICVTAALAAAPPAAQVEWEQLPLVPDHVSQISHGLAFLPGPSPAQDTLLQLRSGGVFRFDETAGTWTRICYVSCGPRAILVTEAGSILIGAPAGPTSTDRSTDRGVTWERDVNDDTATLFQSSLPALRGTSGHGAIFGDTGVSAYRSMEDGAPGTWEVLGSTGGSPVAFGEVPPSPLLPEGRLLAALYNGVSVSDDGGVTWTPGEGAYGYGAYIGEGFAFAPEAGHPYGGAVLAGIDDLTLGRDSSATIYRSDDGGSTWTRVHRFSPAQFGLPNLNTVDLIATPDGVVWAGLTYQAPGYPAAWTGAFARTTDGGLTWEDVSAGYGMYEIRELAVSRDGRLYAATDLGVWRTTGPVYAVASEDDPTTPSTSVAVSVWPNPSGGRVTVGIGLVSPGMVRVSVVDALGREVAVIHDGPARDGQRVAVDTAGWPVGAYTVRVETEAGGASAGLIVVR